jgi:hypothetical protein
MDDLQQNTTINDDTTEIHICVMNVMLNFGNDDASHRSIWTHLLAANTSWLPIMAVRGKDGLQLSVTMINSRSAYCIKQFFYQFCS